MSERRVVTKIVLMLAIVLFGRPSIAEVKPSRKSKTVGDILKRIESNTQKVNFSKSKSALPQFQAAPAQPAKRVDLYSVKPPSRSTLYYEEGTNENELEKVTDDGIKQLFKLSQQFKNSKRRGELWLRLAELYVEKSRLIEYRLQQQHDEALRDFQQGKTKIKPKVDLSASQDYNKKSIQLYEWFLRDFPQDPKVDQALFFLGYNYFELNQPEKGKEYYQRLTKQFPSSSYVDESNFALGEYYFEREQWKDALAYYKAVAANRRARLYSFALYKTAWCQYKSGQVKEALISLERVIKTGRVAKGAGDSSAGGVSRIRLATEAQKDLVIFYAEAGTPENARSYFDQIAGEKQTYTLLEKLAYYYADTGNREGARFIFRSMIEERPNAPKAYDYQYQIVTMFVSSEKGDVFKTELYNWIQNYSPTSDWAQANAKDKELLARANQLIETTLRNFILQQHQTAQNSKVPSAQKTAKSGYELYFKVIKESPKMDEMHFFYAELLFDMREYENAGLNYTWIVENSPNSAYFEKASLNTVLAAEKELPKEEELKKNVGESLEPVPFSKKVASFETSVVRYTEKFPKGENVPAMKYKLGALYYYHNQFDKALDSFNAIIKNYPKSQYAQFSANLTLDIYNLRKDYVGLEKAGQDLLSNQDIANSNVGSQVKGILQRASFKKAQDLEAKKDFSGAALAYEEFSKKNAGTDLYAGAAFNAAVNFERAGDAFKAISMYVLVLNDRNPKNEDIRKKSSQFVAGLYERTGQYRKAAESYESYASKNLKDKESVTFYFNAAVIRDGMNAYTPALTNYDIVFEKARNSDKWESLFLTAKLQERRGNITKAQEFYKKYYDARPKNPGNIIEAAYIIGKIHSRKGQRNEAEEWCKKVIYQQKQFATKENPVGVSYAAECKYAMVARTYDELRSVKIPANPAKQGAAVQQKLGLLNRLKDQLKDVIRYDDAHYVVNSLALIGQAYQHMSASIYSVPLPKGLDAEGMKQYKAGVDKLAMPLQEEAVKSYESAIEKGFKLEGYSDGLKIAVRELGRLSKAKFADYGEHGVQTKLTDVNEAMDDVELGNALKAKDESMLIDVCSKRLGKDPNDLKALIALASLYQDQGKHGLARIILSRAQKAHPDSPAIENNLAVIALSEDKQRVAIAGFRKSLSIRSSYPYASANLGAIFVEYKDYARAADLMSTGYSSVSGDLKKGVAMDVANNYALALSGIGDLEKAKSIYQEILKSDNSNVTALTNYSILLIHRLKDKKEGEKQLNRLKFLADDGRSRAVIEEMEKALSEK
jgi:tetratricopeptide (TPR) repeat protein